MITILIFILVLFLFVTVFYIRDKSYIRAERFVLFYYIVIFASFLGLFIATCIYLSKDYYYSNIIDYYFLIPKGIWNKFIWINIDKVSLIQLINFFSLFFVYSYFYLSVNCYGKSKKSSLYVGVVFGLQVFQLIIFDPFVYKTLYLKLYPDYLSYNSIETIKRVIKTISSVINISVLLISFAIIIVHCMRLPRFRELIYNSILMITGHLVVIITFIYTFSWAPGYFLRVNKIAQNEYTLSIPLKSNYLVYNIILVFQVISFIIIVVCFFFGKYFEYRLKEANRNLRRNIGLADVISRTFIHYIKNETLAILAELELIENEQLSEPVSTAINNIRERCTQTYNELDKIYKNIKVSKINLTSIDLIDIIKTVLNTNQNLLKNITVNFRYPAHSVIIQADSVYFSEVIKNIIINSVEALETLPENRKKIDIEIKCYRNWVVLSITDNGVGIEKEEIDSVFNPYVSSKPTKSNWGLGLFLAQRIISAHDGRIQIKSSKNKYTSVEISLPYYE